MPTLTLDLFTMACDEEASRYRVLDGLQHARGAFGRTEVYPHLSELIHLRADLRRITEEAEALRGGQRGPLSGIDLEAGELRYDTSSDEPLLFDALARWALPHIEATIEEGRALYEFVEERAALRAVGIVPAYRDEGYLLVPDGPRLRVIRYSALLFEQADERYRSLRTAEVDEVPAAALPAQLKRDLAARHPDLPNPAAFRVETEIAFPVEATVLPVAKRKLLEALALGGPMGAA